jgi:hypothetical protein
MNRWRAVVGATNTAALTAAVLAVNPAGAQEGPPDGLLPMSVTPATVSPGQTVTISGDGCVTDSGPGDVQVLLFAPGEEEDPFGELEADSVDDNGHWTLELTATEDDEGVTVFHATCLDPEGEQIIAVYQEGQVEVIVPSSTATTAPPTTTPPAVPAAPAAVVVSADPTFTG